jgi:hypothetical protein
MIKQLRNSTNIFFQKYVGPYWPLLAIIAVFAVVHGIMIHTHNEPSWDAAVYVGMGKYLFSHGTVGTWESLRPIGLPLILGSFWKIGLDPYTAGTMLIGLASIGLLTVTYFFAERIRSGSGAIAATLIGATGVFLGSSIAPTTDIISPFFAMLALFLTYRATKHWQYATAGFVAAIGFMFRFPHGLLLVVGIVVIAIKVFYEPTLFKIGRSKIGDRVVVAIERMFAFAGGFFLLVVPYLISNQVMYGNAFLPFIEGTKVIKLYPSLYQKGPWFYLIEILKANPLFAFSLLPIALFWKKQYRTLGMVAIVTATVVIGAYFTYEAHKEARYMLAFLPYLAVLAGVGIFMTLEHFKLPQLLFFGLLAIAGFMLNAHYLVYRVPTADNVLMHDFYSYLSTVPQDHVRIISSTPYPLAYSNAFLVRNLYSDWNDAYWAYNTLKNNTDYILLNSCNLETGCADNSRCTDDKQLLLDTLAQHDTEVFSGTTATQCQLSIYKIAH